VPPAAAGFLTARDRQVMLPSILGSVRVHQALTLCEGKMRSLGRTADQPNEELFPKEVMGPLW
jgi:hypothetical protein